MSNNKRNTTRGGTGLPTILFLIFLVLKLTGAISWSWWWVTAPLWISVGLGILVVCLAVVIVLAILAGLLIVLGWVELVRWIRRRYGRNI